MIAHPNAAWKIISKHLLTESSINRFGITNWLGESGFEDRPEIGTINHLPHEEIIDWIKENPEERLCIIEQVLPKTLDKDKGGSLTANFIEDFCSDHDSKVSLFGHFWSGGWTGPESKYLERKRDAARKWLAQTSSLKIQLWIEKYIEYLNSQIEKTQIDEEREF